MRFIVMEGQECKYCNNLLKEIENEGLCCKECSNYVHLKCLQRGSLPGGLHGDVFFEFTCKDCALDGNEVFIRDKISWFQTITLVLYHLNKKSSGLARKSFFHWNIHLASFIQKNWNIIFKKDFKQTKKWTGTIPGTLSLYSPHFFTSGKTLFNEQGWWTLTYPNLSPYVMAKLYGDVLSMKQKIKEQGGILNETQIVNDILKNRNYKPEYTISSLTIVKTNAEDDSNYVSEIKKENLKQIKLGKQKKHLLPSLESICERPTKKLYKESNREKDIFVENMQQNEDIVERKMIVGNDQKLKYLDPFCHYNTSLESLSCENGMQLKFKLLGKLREEPILSPYSNIYLKPYIRRDFKSTPNWLKLMAEVLVKSNEKHKNWTLPPRAPLDYTYVQPDHIPAINSLCNQFFWPGIDLTECLQYPDFSCVVLYKKLIVAFAFIVPDVKFNENYLSFIFTRPGWRNIGIGKFMIYHLIQMSMGKDITLHVSINNPGLFLYQKFGFKVENVVLDFYDKYMRNNTGESKHAFFCRLER